MKTKFQSKLCIDFFKDAECGPLSYPAGYILHNLYRKHQSKASKKTNICQEKEEFMTLLNSLHIDEPIAKDAALLVPKIVIYSRWTLAQQRPGNSRDSYGICESAGEEAKGLDPDRSKIRGEGGETDDPTSGPPVPQKGTPQESS